MSETITIRPYSNTTPSTPTYSNIANMYDGDETTSGYLTTSVKVTSTTTVTQSNITYLRFDLSAIPANAVVTKLELYSRGGYSIQGGANGISASRYYQFGFYDSVTLIGSNVSYDTSSSMTTKSIALTDETQISAFLNSTNPRARVRCYTSGRRKSGTASASLSTTVRVYDTYLIVTYELPTSAKVKVNGTWEDGTVKVKANGTWVDAKKIYAKVNGEWIET